MYARSSRALCLGGALLRRCGRAPLPLEELGQLPVGHGKVRTVRHESLADPGGQTSANQRITEADIGEQDRSVVIAVADGAACGDGQSAMRALRRR